MPKLNLPKLNVSELMAKMPSGAPSEPSEQTDGKSNSRRQTTVLGGATLVCALGIGYVMQYGAGLPFSVSAPDGSPVTLSAISPTSSSADIAPPRAPVTQAGTMPVALPQGLADSVNAIVPETPTESAMLAGLGPDSFALTNDDRPVVTAATAPKAYVSPQIDTAEAPAEDPEVLLAAAEPDIAATRTDMTPKAAPVVACDITMSASPSAGALIDVSLIAPCHAGERVTLHHQGMMFTEVMPTEGALTVSVPALSEQALVIASFASGDGSTAMTDVPSLGFYDRIAVQWRGDTGLGLHAREFGADYFTKGHIHAEARGDMAVTARGDGGFLTVLGNAETPDPLRVEVYSFPRGAAHATGEIAMTVEAEITAGNCDQTVEAQTLEVRGERDLRTRNLTLDMPGCSTTGDFLVLKNLVEDLTIAAR